MDPFEQEEQLEKSYDSVLMKRLLKFAKPYRHLIVLSILLLLLMTLGDLARPYLIKLAIDDHIDITGRQYLAYESSVDVKDAIPFNNRTWARAKDLPEGYPIGEPYTMVQYEKNSYLVPGHLMRLREGFDIAEQDGRFLLIRPEDTREAIHIPTADISLFRQVDIRGLTRLAFIFLAIALAVFGLNFLQVMILQYTGQKILYDLRQHIFTHLQKLPLSFYDNNPVGKLVTRVTNDTETLNEMYTGVLVNLFKDIFMLLGIIVVMLRINYRLAMISLATLPIILIATIVFRIYARQAYREVRTQLSKINTFLSEHISGMKIIQIFHQETNKKAEFDESNKGYYKAALREMKIFAVFRPVIEFLFAIALSLLLWFGGGQYIRGVLEFGVLYAFISYIQMFFQPINDLTEKYNIMQSAMASSEKIFYLLDQKDTIPDPEEAMPFENIQGKITFENVWFAYNNEDWVLRDVSFTIEPGETVAFVGATGAGKTSIINLISRFYEIQKGRILIDDIPINQVKKDDLRQRIGVVLQDVFLFAGTIESNIRLNNKNISREIVKDIADYVNAGKFIDKLPDGYDEKVMERGSTLSAGQRQLLAFARALAFDPTILVLDEATASIDTETEALIQDALLKLIRGRTTIAIAHRLSTVQHANKIIVLHKGKIREMGNHQELLTKRGLYYQLYQLQYKNGEAV